MLRPTNYPNSTNSAPFPSNGDDDDGKIVVEEATHVLCT